MKKFGLIFFLFFLSNYSVVAQKNTVGFHCGYAAIPSADVSSMAELLKNNDIESIRKGLVSPALSIRFLSVIILERLEKRGAIKFTVKDKEQISANQSIERYVNVCNGCLGDETIKLSKLLTSSYYKKEAEKWADEIIEKNNL